MKTLFLFLALRLTAAAPPPPVVPAPTVQVITPLSFGGILVEPGGGRITLTAQGSLLPEGPGATPGYAPPAGYARFSLKGPANGTFRIWFDPARPSLRGPSGRTVQIAGLLPSIPALTGKFNASGQTQLILGGTLDIPNLAPSGLYTGTCSLSMSVNGLPSVSQNFAVTCTLRAPLIMNVLAPLDFAGLAPGSLGGTFHLGASGDLNRQGSAGPILVKGTPHPAALRLTGPSGAAYRLLMPDQAFLLGPGPALRLHTFNCDQPVSGVLPGGGLLLHVGADLDMNAAQPAGTYSGQLVVTVAYL